MIPLLLYLWSESVLTCRKISMAQQQLPLFPVGSTGVTQGQAFEKRDGRVTYFYGTLKVFSHDENDLASLQLIPTQHPVLYQWLCQTNGDRPCIRCLRKGGGE